MFPKRINHAKKVVVLQFCLQNLSETKTASYRGKISLAVVICFKMATTTTTMKTVGLAVFCVLSFASWQKQAEGRRMLIQLTDSSVKSNEGGPSGGKSVCLEVTLKQCFPQPDDPYNIYLTNAGE